MFRNIFAKTTTANAEEGAGMSDSKKIEALEERVRNLEKLVNVVTGEYERVYEYCSCIAIPITTEKTVPVNKAVAALLDHLGLKLAATKEKTETTPERVTLVPIKEPAKGRKK